MTEIVKKIYENNSKQEGERVLISKVWDWYVGDGKLIYSSSGNKYNLKHTIKTFNISRSVEAPKLSETFNILPYLHPLHAGTEGAEHIQIIITYAQEAYNIIPDQIW